MPRTHVPVLAGELIEALDPRPGQVAIDCTLGAAGHARLVADRLGPSGTLIAIDRDPLAEKAFAELAAEVPCATRFIRADFEHGLRALAEEAHPLARLTALCALAREESRGAHQRRDRPATEPRLEGMHAVVGAAGAPVFEHWE